MRYTTILDITEFPSLYETTNTRLVYLHLALKAGHQAYNKGMVITTLTRLSNEVGVTVSALRWSLNKLQKFGLVKVDTVKAKYSRQIRIYVGKKIDKRQNVTI